MKGKDTGNTVLKATVASMTVKGREISISTNQPPRELIRPVCAPTYRNSTWAGVLEQQVNPQPAALGHQFMSHLLRCDPAPVDGLGENSQG